MKEVLHLKLDDYEAEKQLWVAVIILCIHDAHRLAKRLKRNDIPEVVKLRMYDKFFEEINHEFFISILSVYNINSEYFFDHLRSILRRK